MDEQPVVPQPAAPIAPIAQPTISIQKRVFSFLGYIVIFYFVSKTIATLLVVGTTIALYFFGSDVTATSWIFIAERGGAAIVGIIAAWIVGRYFHWVVFRKNPREQKPHGWFVKSMFYSTSSILVLLFILLATPSVLGLFLKDIPSADDSDLHLPTISIPGNQNIYPDLMAASKVLDTSYDTQQLRDIVSGDNWNNTFAAQAIASNTLALALFSSTTQKSTFQDPISAQPDTLSLNTVLVSINGWRALVRFNALEALYLAHSGKGTEGLQTAIVSIKAAQKIEMSQGTLIDWLVAVSMKNQALQTIQTIIASTTVSTKDLKSLATDLQPYTNDGSGLIKAYKLTYYEQKSTIEYLVHGDTSDAGTSGELLTVSSQIDRTNFYYHPNQSVSLLAGDVRQKIANAQSSCDNLVESEPIKTLPSNLFLLYITPNAIGKIFHDITAVSLNSAKIKECQENVLLSATRILAGLKAYQLDNKKLPVSLDELVPTYLNDMPLDPFSGQKFKYDPTKRIIYSVGENKNDIGGNTGNDWQSMENPTFPISL